MRYLFATLVGVLVLSTPAMADESARGDFDWKPWRQLAVLDGGRAKPLDTLAWETLRMLCNRASFTDPESGQKLDPTALYLSLVFDYQAAPATANPHGFGPSRRSLQNPDKWDRADLLRVDYLPLHAALGIAEGQKYVSPYQLSQAKILDPATEKETSFVMWAEKLARKPEKSLSDFERKGLELASNLWTYQDVRAGKRLAIVPIPGSRDQAWASVSELRSLKLDESKDPQGRLRKVQEQFDRVQAAYRAGSAAEFNDASEQFLATTAEIGPELGDYPSPQTINLEVAYNHWAPYRLAWGLTLLASLLATLGMGLRWKPLYAAGFAAFALGLVAMIAGFWMRAAISGRVPVTNMYESVVYVAMAGAVFGLIFELIYRKQYILLAASIVSTVALVLADNCPAVLDSSLRPLQPVLRSNFWLVLHVMSITASYGALALALVIGDITLGFSLFRVKNEEAMGLLTTFTYRLLQVGVLLLAAGTFLGGVWADFAWGRFWGWDPKEVWALVSLLGYLAVLHARYVGWVQDLGLAALSAICFSLVVMAWYGVNFVLGAGLHSYGFGGGGGQVYVYAVVFAQFLYVAMALLREPAASASLADNGADSPAPTHSQARTTAESLTT